MQSTFQQPAMFNERMFKCFGAFLTVLAVSTLSLAVANVVLTKESYCNPWNEDTPPFCSRTKEPFVWTWVASGIWASLPILLAGILAMCISSDPLLWTRTRCFALFIFLSAIVFSPGIVVLSSMEVWRGHAAESNFYKFDSGLMVGNITVGDSPYRAKFALPLIIAILGGVMFIMTGLVALAMCCCMETLGIYMPQDQYGYSGFSSSQDQCTPGSVFPRVTLPQHPGGPEYPPPIVVKKEVFYPPRPQITMNQNKNFNGIGYQPSGGPNIATRFSSSGDPYGTGVPYGQLPSRSAAQDSFFQPHSSDFWS